MSTNRSLRVGVLFGGRSGEHAVSLNSARNVMDALAAAGHQVVPLGIAPDGRWLTGADSYARLTGATAPRNGHVAGARGALNGAVNHAGPAAIEADDAWALLPHAQASDALPAVDILFPVLHGTYGEDGTVQGLLEMANLPYVGCGVLASAVAMDKALVKQLFSQAGLPQVAHRTVLRRHWRSRSSQVLDELLDALSLPLFVKPANLGSSVGITKAHDRTELAAALDEAARYDRKLVVEAAVPNAREIEVSVLGNDEPVASVPGEIVPGHEFYDYAAKYLDESSSLLIPAPLSLGMSDEVQQMAIAAFRAIDGSGLARVDFLLDDRSGALYLNEINTMPGFTRISMYPKLWEASGLSYPELVNRLLDLALERYAERQENETTFGDGAF